MDVLLEKTLEIKPNQSDAEDTYSYEKNENKDPKKKGKKAEPKIVKNPDDKPKEGVISCIVVRVY